MSDSFIIPEGITLSMTDDGLVIENEGDIILNGNIAGGVHKLTSRNGNVVLGNDFALHRIDAPYFTLVFVATEHWKILRAKPYFFLGALSL